MMSYAVRIAGRGRMPVLLLGGVFLMHNIELKAELRDLPLARTICKSEGATFILSFEQTDTYFRIPRGRLKRRETEGEPVEYIFYERANRAAPKLSHFTIFSEEQAAERFGTQPLPVWAIVRKRRELWLLGSVRIHLDKVDRLGTFLEFECLVSKENNIARSHEAIAALRRAFAPVLGELIDCSYSDLLTSDLENKLTPEQRSLPEP
jgi:adenylate cyclase, class 2